MDFNMYYKLFANCIPINGYSRSLIIDLQRRRYRFIPNDLFLILTKFHGNSVNQIKQSYNNVFDSIIEEYFQILNKEEMIFFVKSKSELKRFLEINYQFSNPFRISNSIIDIDKIENITSEIVQQYDDLNIINLQIRCFSDTNLQELIYTYQMFEETIVSNIELIVRYSDLFEINIIQSEIEKLSKLTRIVFHSSPIQKMFKLTSQRDILYLKKDCGNPNKCGQINIENFCLSYKYYAESNSLNTCLNRKICIDSDGYIKNCPSMKHHYGHISDTTLAEAIEKPGFKDCWFIKKDDIDVCQDCEFRHICTDCRAFIKDPNNIYSQPAKCGYNPYIAKWQNEDGWISVEQWRKENPEWEKQAIELRELHKKYIAINE